MTTQGVCKKENLVIEGTENEKFEGGPLAELTKVCTAVKSTSVYPMKISSIDDWCSKRFIHWSPSPNLFPSRNDQDQAWNEEVGGLLKIYVFLSEKSSLNEFITWTQNLEYSQTLKHHLTQWIHNLNSKLWILTDTQKSSHSTHQVTIPDKNNFFHIYINYIYTYIVYIHTIHTHPLNF